MQEQQPHKAVPTASQTHCRITLAALALTAAGSFRGSNNSTLTDTHHQHAGLGDAWDDGGFRVEVTKLPEGTKPEETEQRLCLV